MTTELAPIGRRAPPWRPKVHILTSGLPVGLAAKAGPAAKPGEVDVAGRIPVHRAVGGDALHEEAARIVDRIGAELPAIALDAVAELAVVQPVRDIAAIDTKDRGIAQRRIDAEQPGEPLGAAVAGLTSPSAFLVW